MAFRSLISPHRIAAILLATSAVGMAQDPFVLSDFESGAGMNSLGGYWYFFGDKGSEGNSRITTSDSITGMWDTSSVGNGYGGSVHSGRFGWVFGDKRPVCGTECTYDPEVNMTTELFAAGDSVRDLSGATQIRFHAKANAPVKVSFLVRIASVKDYAFHRQEIEVTRDWKEFTIALQGSSSFSQPSWGARVPFDPSQVIAFQWQAGKGRNPDLTSDTLLIDDLRIVGWVPPNPNGIRRAPHALPGARSRFVALGQPGRISVSLADVPTGRGGEILVQDIRGRVLARHAFRAGQAAAEVQLGSGRTGLAMVRIVPSR